MIRHFRLYTFAGFLRLSISYIRTKLFYPKARLIRFPFDLRGSKFVKFGKGFTTGIGCRIEAYPDDQKSTAIVFGTNVQLNDYVHITSMKNVTIGNNVLMASKIYISDCSHGFYSGGNEDSSPESVPIDREYKINPVAIEDNVWIGESVSVLPGVTIKKGSIIGANSVVTKDIPEYTIAAGNPAKIIKKYNFETKRWQKAQ